MGMWECGLIGIPHRYKKKIQVDKDHSAETGCLLLGG